MTLEQYINRLADYEYQLAKLHSKISEIHIDRAGVIEEYAEMVRKQTEVKFELGENREL